MMMKKQNKNLRSKTLQNYYHPPPLTFSTLRLCLSIPLIRRTQLTSYGKTTILKVSLSGMLNISDTKEKELNFTTHLTSRMLLYKDLILSESMSLEASESMGRKETMKSEESGYGEELESLNILRKIYPTLNIMNGLNLITLKKLTENFLKIIGPDSLMMFLLPMDQLLEILDTLSEYLNKIVFK